jgi:two-component system, response regulator YesN
VKLTKGRLHIKTYFIKFFIPITLLMVISMLIMFTTLFSLFTTSLVSQINNISHKSLVQSQNMVEFTLAQATNTFTQLVANNDVIKQMNLHERDMLLENRLLIDLNNIIYNNSNVYSISIFNSYMDSFLTTDYPNTEEETIKWLKEENIYHGIQIIPRKIKLKWPENGTKNVFSLIYYDKDKSSNKVLNAFILNIDQETIHNRISASEDDENTIVFDSKGIVMSSKVSNEFLEDFANRPSVKSILLEGRNDFTEYVKDTKYLIVHDHSEKLNWNFMYMIPYDKAMSSFHKLRNLVVVVCILLLLACLFVSAFISRKLSSPISKIAKNIITLGTDFYQSQGNTANEIQALSSFHVDIASKLEKLKITRQDTLSQIKANYLRDVLKGLKQPEQDDLEEMKLNLALDADGDLSIIIIHIDPILDLQSVETNVFEEKVEKDFSMAIYSLVVEKFNAQYLCDAFEDGNRIVLAIRISETDFAALKVFLQEIQAYILKSLDTSVTVSVGTSIKEITELSESYRKASEIFRYKIVYGEGSILLHDEVMHNIKYEPGYPYNLEKSLLESIRMGKIETIEYAIQEIFNNLKYCSYDIIVLTINHLLFSIFSVTDLSNSLHNDKELSDFNIVITKVRKLETLVHIKEWMISYIHTGIQRTSEMRKNSSTLLQNKIVEFIENNYFSADLSIEMVATKFSYNHIYFGKLFKEMFNQTFMEYVTKLRINRVNRYLETDEYTIKEICVKVGFNNPSYFVTWFKKNTGLSPTEYRRMHLQKEY